MLRAKAFEATYDPQPAPSGSDFWEWEEVKALHPNVTLVWSVIEEAGKTYVVPGYHIVNRIGYVVTKHPWRRGDEIARW